MYVYAINIDTSYKNPLVDVVKTLKTCQLYIYHNNSVDDAFGKHPVRAIVAI